MKRLLWIALKLVTVRFGKCPDCNRWKLDTCRGCGGCPDCHALLQVLEEIEQDHELQD